MVGMEFFNVTFAMDDHNEDSAKMLLIKQIKYKDEVKIGDIELNSVYTVKLQCTMLSVCLFSVVFELFQLATTIWWH